MLVLSKKLENEDFSNLTLETREKILRNKFIFPSKMYKGVDKIFEWCQEHITGFWYPYQEDIGWRSLTSIAFENENDAMLFKLAWESLST